MVALTNGYRLKITRASRMSELADRVITALAAIGGQRRLPQASSPQSQSHHTDQGSSGRTDHLPEDFLASFSWAGLFCLRAVDL